jgi:hypothetical protein
MVVLWRKGAVSYEQGTTVMSRMNAPRSRVRQVAAQLQGGGPYGGPMEEGGSFL